MSEYLVIKIDFAQLREHFEPKKNEEEEIVQVKQNEKKYREKCPLCRGRIKDYKDLTFCPRCHALYHLSCVIEQLTIGEELMCWACGKEHLSNFPGLETQLKTEKPLQGRS